MNRIASATKHLEISWPKLERLGDAALAVLASASALYTYQGVISLLTEEQDSWWLRAVGAVFAIAVGVGLFTAWAYVMRAVPHLLGFRGRLIGLVVVCMTSFAAVVTSSWLNAAALAGASAREQHLIYSLEQFEQLANSANAQRARVRQIIPDLRVHLDKFKSLEQQERASGLITGSAGLGTMTATLTQVSQSFASLIQTIEDYTSKTDETAAEIGAALTEARKVFRSRAPLEERERLFADQMTIIQNNVIEMQEGGVLAGVRRQAQSIQANLVLTDATGSTSQLKQAQRQGQTDVHTQLASIGTGLTAAVDEIAQGALEVPTFRQLSTTEAVIAYWRSNVPAWAAAIGIDLLPLILLVAMIGIVEQQRDIELQNPSKPAAENHKPAEQNSAWASNTTLENDSNPSKPTMPDTPLSTDAIVKAKQMPQSQEEAREIARRALENHETGFRRRGHV